MEKGRAARARSPAPPLDSPVRLHRQPPPVYRRIGRQVFDALHRRQARPLGRGEPVIDGGGLPAADAAKAGGAAGGAACGGGGLVATTATAAQGALCGWVGVLCGRVVGMRWRGGGRGGRARARALRKTQAPKKTKHSPSTPLPVPSRHRGPAGGRPPPPHRPGRARPRPPRQRPRRTRAHSGGHRRRRPARARPRSPSRGACAGRRGRGRHHLHPRRRGPWRAGWGGRPCRRARAEEKRKKKSERGEGPVASSRPNAGSLPSLPCAMDAPLAGLALVLDRGTDATFAVLSLVRQAQVQGLKVRGARRERRGAGTPLPSLAPPPSHPPTHPSPPLHRWSLSPPPTRRLTTRPPCEKPRGAVELVMAGPRRRPRHSDPTRSPGSLSSPPRPACGKRRQGGAPPRAPWPGRRPRSWPRWRVRGRRRACAWSWTA